MDTRKQPKTTPGKRGRSCVSAPAIAYSIAQFAAACTLSRGQVYKEIEAGRLKTVKVGRRRIVPASAAHEWLDSLSSGRGE